MTSYHNYRPEQEDDNFLVDLDAAEHANQSIQRMGSKMKSKNSFQQHNHSQSSMNGIQNGEQVPLDTVLPKLAKRKSSNGLMSDPSTNNYDMNYYSSVGSPESTRSIRKGSRVSLTVEKSKGLGQLEALRTADIQTDSNSAASQAFDALKVNRSQPPLDFNNKKKVEGREIRQDHELYGMTYGMMLGMRVLTGRRELYNFGEVLEPQHIGQGTSTTGKGSPKNRQLTDEDYDYELELDFPPEGSKGRTADGSTSHPLYATPPHKMASPFKFKDYMANVFNAIRSQSGIDEAEYMISIAGDFNYIEFIANSKSGQFFFYSHDGKYMIKTQTKEESKLLRKIMPQYVGHLAQNPKSLLCRFYGMHRVKMSAISRAPIYFVVMSSVFNSDLPIHVKYDIKGSTVGRLVSEEACKAGSVQKDLNLVESGRILRLGPGLVDVFLDVLSADALFLRTLRIMDYSLLIGIHEIGSTKEGRRMSGVVPSSKKSLNYTAGVNTGRNMNRRGSYATKGDRMFNSYHGGILAAPNPDTGVRDEVYFFGIIDILQVYNSSKRAETFFKGITSNSRDLSSVDPDFYAIRFISFITDHTDYALHRPKTPEKSPKITPKGSKYDIIIGGDKHVDEEENKRPASTSPSSFAAAIIAKLSPRNLLGSGSSNRSSPRANSSSNNPSPKKSPISPMIASRKVFFSDEGSESTHSPKSENTSRSKTPSPSNLSKNLSNGNNVNGFPSSTISPKQLSSKSNSVNKQISPKNSDNYSQNYNNSNQKHRADFEAMVAQRINSSPYSNYNQTTTTGAAATTGRFPTGSVSRDRMVGSSNQYSLNNPTSPSLNTNVNFNTNTNTNHPNMNHQSSYEFTGSPGRASYDGSDNGSDNMSPDRLAQHPSFIALRNNGAMSFRGRGGMRTRNVVQRRPVVVEQTQESTSPSKVGPFRFETYPSTNQQEDMQSQLQSQHQSPYPYQQQQNTDGQLSNPSSPKKKRNAAEPMNNPHFGSGILRKQSTRNMNADT